MLLHSNRGKPWDSKVEAGRYSEYSWWCPSIWHSSNKVKVLSGRDAIEAKFSMAIRFYLCMLELWMGFTGGSMRLLSRTQLRDFTFTFHFHALEKEMATHSSVLAWRIPGMGEPCGRPSMGSHRVGHDWSDLAAAAAAAEGKETAFNEGDLGSVPGLGRYPGEGNG